jgi:predicted DNA-binding protein
MPVKIKEFIVPIGLRISSEQAQKLDLLAAKTGRQRNALLRHLIDRAYLGQPEIGIDLQQARDDEELAQEASQHGT